MELSERSKYTISVMSQNEMAIAIDWAAKEDWNPGLNDASTFYAADNTGFLIGRIGNTPIATISAVKYVNSFGFIGLYIVKEEFRGRGYGLSIWKEAVSRLKGRNMGLDGVLAQQNNYKKSGFKLAHRNIRFAGKSVKNQNYTSKIVKAKDIDLPLLEEYDRSFFPEARSAFIKSWINQNRIHALVIIENSKILGYGCIRACIQGFKIGPLYAENDSLAFELFTALTNSIPTCSDVLLDVPEPNQKAIDIAQRAGMSPSFETARMYTGNFPEISLSKIYGITSFELG